MAVLSGELSASQGTYNDSHIYIVGNSSTAQGSGISSLLVSLGSVAASTSNVLESITVSSGYAFVNQSMYQQYLLRLVRFFGANAKQTSTQLIIQKSDFNNLTAKSNNSAESLFINLLLYIATYESNSLISTTTVEHFSTDLIPNGINTIIQTNLLINLFTIPTKVELFEYVLNNNVLPNDFI